MEFDLTFPLMGFNRVDELLRSDHPCLDQSDECYFVGEYTARNGVGYSETNLLISNFRRAVAPRYKLEEWYHKEAAIRFAATLFWAGIPPDAMNGYGSWAFIPVPPSQMRGDPDYDDRLMRMLRQSPRIYSLDVPRPNVWELVIQSRRTEPVLPGGERMSPEELRRIYQLNKALPEWRSSVLYPRVKDAEAVVIVDDLLVTGAHFRAMKSILQEQFPDAEIIGLFIARAVPGSF